MSLLRRALVALAVVAVTLAALAGVASAHAELISTEPGANAILTTPPREITLKFGEPVEVSLGAIRLFDGKGNEISVSPPAHPGGTGSVVETDVPALPTGAYVVAWRVVSADSHPVHGAFTFQVGAGSGVTDPNLVANILASEGGRREVGLVLGVARFAAYAALAVLVGGVVLLVVAWPAGRRSRRARVVLWSALAVGVVATAVGIAVQAPYAEGSDLSRMFEPSGWRAVVVTRSGRAWEARLVLLAAAGSALLASLRWLRTTAWRFGAILTGFALVAAYAESGHGGVGRSALAGIVATVCHLSAMSVWVGGLVLLAAVVLPTTGPAVAVGVTRRFSTFAFVAVAVIVASGLVQSWRQVGSLDALTTTTYGRILLVKTTIVAVLIGVGAVSRRALQRRLLDWHPTPVPRAVGAAVDLDEPPAAGAADDDDAVRRKLRRSIGAEVLLAGAVLAVTSLLVATTPAIATTSGPFNASVLQGSRIANVAIIPAAVGRNTLHVYVLTPGGSLEAASSIDVTITNVERNIGPLAIAVEVAGPNHVTTDAMQVPFAGTWQLQIKALFGDFDQTTFTTNFRVT